MRTQPKSGQGFTLIEMLVVMAIIGALAAILLPMLLSARGSAQKTACKNNLHQLWIAMNLYRREHDEYYPHAAILPSLELNELPRICDVLENYAGNPQVFRCPYDRKRYFENEGSSYEYNVRLGGRKGPWRRVQSLMGDERTPLFYDYEEFHGAKGAPSARNFVFLDGHVAGGMGFELEEDDDE